MIGLTAVGGSGLSNLLPVPALTPPFLTGPHARPTPPNAVEADRRGPGFRRRDGLVVVRASAGVGARLRCPRSDPAPRPPVPSKTGADTLDGLEGRVSEVSRGSGSRPWRWSTTAADAPSGTRRVASGVVINAEGDVLSIRIDAPPASSPVVARVASGRRLPADWVASDPETGLTLLKIAPDAARPAAPFAARGAAGHPRPGDRQPVRPGALGQPGARRRPGPPAGTAPRQLGGLIQVDASLHPGDSGALLADLQGGWLGVIRSGLAPPSESDRKGRDLDHDLGFAIPARHALWVAEQLRTRTRVDRAYLGVTMDLDAPAPPPGEPDGAVLGRVLADTPGQAHRPQGGRPGRRSSTACPSARLTT